MHLVFSNRLSVSRMNQFRRVSKINTEHSFINADNVTYITQNFINQSKSLCFDGIEVAVAEEIFLDLLPCMARMFSHEVKQLNLKPFLLTLAIVDDIGAILVIGVGAVSVWAGINGNLPEVIETGFTLVGAPFCFIFGERLYLGLKGKK